MNVYYAHSMRIYNTQEEQDDICAIIDIVPKTCQIDNPNKKFPSANAWLQWMAEEHMKFYDAVYFARHQGHIGKGQYAELEQAIKFKVPIFEIKDDGSVEKIIRPHLHIIDGSDWKIHYGDIHGNKSSTKRRSGNKS